MDPRGRVGGGVFPKVKTGKLSPQSASQLCASRVVTMQIDSGRWTEVVGERGVPSPSLCSAARP